MEHHAHRSFVSLLAALVVAGASACGSSGTPADGGVDLTIPARLSTDVQPILNNFCSPCHTTQSPPSASLNLSAGQSHAMLVGVTDSCGTSPNRTRVVAGNAGQSYLIDKLLGAGTICGVRMPQGGPPLSTAQIDIIRSWINAGAQDN